LSVWVFSFDVLYLKIDTTSFSFIIHSLPVISH
jgi:hypothetical protein